MSLRSEAVRPALVQTATVDVGIVTGEIAPANEHIVNALVLTILIGVGALPVALDLRIRPDDQPNGSGLRRSRMPVIRASTCSRISGCAGNT